MLMVEFSIAPLGVGQSVAAHVARALDIVDRSGLDYELHAMGTIVEGDWDRVFAVIKQCFEAIRLDCPRVTMSLKADWRDAPAGRIRAKVTGVETVLGRKLRTAGE